MFIGRGKLHRNIKKKKCKNNFGVCSLPRERISKSESLAFREISRFVQAQDSQVWALADMMSLQQKNPRLNVDVYFTCRF